MTWTEHYDGDYWTIESNATVGENKEFYRWEKSFIRITCKDVVNQEALTVDGIRYQFYSDNEVSIIEITDLIRAYSGGTITFVNDAALTVYELEWLAIDGERPTSQNTDILPFEIPFNALNTIPFWFQCTEAMQKSVDGVWTDFHTTGILSFDVQDLETLEVRQKDSGQPTTFINSDCWTDKILVEWVGRFGQLKSWWFKVERTVYGSDKQVNIQTLENGYNTLKNKRTGLLLSHKRADQITQHYLSDIVLSDSVYVYTSSAATSKTQVRIENNSFEVSPRKQDVNITVNLYAYDTI